MEMIKGLLKLLVSTEKTYPAGFVQGFAMASLMFSLAALSAYLN